MGATQEKQVKLVWVKPELILGYMDETETPKDPSDIEGASGNLS